MKVEKRDGTIQDFKFEKIERVITKVFNNKLVNEEVPEKFIEQIKQYFDSFIEKHDETYIMPIEDIQDTIRDFLIKKNKIKAAETFIIVRKKRDDLREQKLWLTKEIAKKLKGSNIENQNANVDEMSFGGRMGEAASVATRDYGMKHVMSKQTRDNHNNNEVYTHDSDHLALGDHNCLSYPEDKILKKGFYTRQTDVRPAGSINTASQLVAVNFQLQSLQQFGGVSATHLDWTMVPYVRKSFMKHYLVEYVKSIDEFYTLDLLNLAFENLHKWVSKHTIDYLLENNLDDNDFYFGTTKLNPKWYQCGLFETIQETYQAVEGLYHNLNTLQSRSGNQLPFTSINYGTCTIPEGRLYTKALLEVSLQGTGKFGRTSIFPCGIFQYKKGINNKPGTPNYDLYRLALKSTSKRLYPNYANCDWSNQVSQIEADRKLKSEVINSLSDEDTKRLYNICVNNKDLVEQLSLVIKEDGQILIDYTEQPYEIFSTMGCRTANGFDINFREVYEANIRSVIETGELKYDDMYSGAQKDGRGNICPVTIILPTLAMRSKLKIESIANSEDRKYLSDEVVNEFMSLLDKKIHEAKDSLIERFKYIASQSADSAKYMYENGTMCGYNKEEGIVSALKHGTLAIGQLGLSETLYILIGCNQTTEKGMELAKQIEALYLKRTTEFKEEYKLNFGVYYTPAENLCYTAFKKWRSEFGDLENVTYFIDENGERQEKKYFTNSMHVPVYKQISPFKKIDIESELTGYSNAGCITYVEVMHDVIHNLEALEELVNYAMDKDIPYFAINLPSDQCEECGYQGNIGDVCPKCGSEHVSRLRRVTGYLTGDYKSAFNKGKVQEADQRVKHKDIMSFNNK